MSSAEAAFDLTMLCVAVAAAVLACALLAVNFFANQRVSRHAPGVLAGLLAIFAIIAYFSGTKSVAAGCGGLALLMPAIWPISFDSARLRLTRLVTPQTVCVFVLCTSLIASRFLAANVLQSLKDPPAELDLEDVPVVATQAVTDKGRAVGLFHFKLHSSPEEIKRFIGADERSLAHFIRLTEPSAESNCHGWVFTGGRYGIRDPEIAAILADNDYVEVEQPREGDLAIYYKGDRISHSGLVRMASKESPILVESKWGPFGVYLHPFEKHPWPGPCKFFRSPRENHLLALQPEIARAVSMRIRE